MKIRTGFVSNSSSSSFVVAFPHKPKSVEDLKKMMFGKQEWHYISYYAEENGPHDIPTQDIVEIVFRDIKDKKQATKKEITESIRDGYFDAYIDPKMFPGHYDNWDTIIHLDPKKDQKEIEKKWKEAENINEKRAKDIAEAFTDASDKNFIVVLNYGDKNGQMESILEHTNVFNRLGNIRTSYH